MKTLAVGSNGIAGTMLAGVARMTNGRSDDGALSVDMLRRLKRIAGAATGPAAHGNGRLCSIGHTTRVGSDSTSHTGGRYRDQFSFLGPRDSKDLHNSSFLSEVHYRRRAHAESTY